MMRAAYQKAWAKIEGVLWMQVLIALLAGLLVGTVLGPDLNLLPHETALQISNWLASVGYLFLALITMVVVPLVISSVINGIAGGDNVETVKMLGIRIVFYFLFTTTVAVAIGASIATLIEPGKEIHAEVIDNMLISSQKSMSIDSTQAAQTAEALADTSNIPKRLVDLIPRNPFNSFASGEMLQIVIFSAIFGAALLFMEKKKAAPLLALTQSTQETCMVVVAWVLRLAPLAIFGLITQLIVKMGFSVIFSMGLYVGTVLLGLILMLCFYMALLFFFAGRNPLAFIGNVKNVQLIAFSTSSSSATMPVTLKSAEAEVGVKPSIARFVIPLGTTINMDGTAMYQTIATLFLAQVFAIDLGFSEILIILITAIAASIGTPGTPGVGVVILASILTSVGIPAEGIAIILGVDRILDMCRTAINVTGDLVACVIMEKVLSKKEKKILAQG